MPFRIFHGNNSSNREIHSLDLSSSTFAEFILTCNQNEIIPFKTKDIKGNFKAFALRNGDKAVLRDKNFVPGMYFFKISADDVKYTLEVKYDGNPIKKMINKINNDEIPNIDSGLNFVLNDYIQANITAQEALNNMLALGYQSSYLNWWVEREFALKHMTQVQINQLRDLL
jgi:hypothetical protein